MDYPESASGPWNPESLRKLTLHEAEVIFHHEQVHAGLISSPDTARLEQMCEVLKEMRADPAYARNPAYSWMKCTNQSGFVIMLRKMEQPVGSEAA